MPKQRNNDLKVHEKIIRYFDKTDLGEKLSAVDPVNSDIRIMKREFVVQMDNELAKNLSLIAKKKRISSSTLLHRWIEEKVVENAVSRR